MLVCPSCFGESETLSKRFDEKGTDSTCPTCETEDTRVLEAKELSDLFEGLKKQYDPLMGNPYVIGKYGIRGMGEDNGDPSLAELLSIEWDVFSDTIDSSDADAILAEVWPGCNGEYFSKGNSAWGNVSVQWKALKKSLKHEWRYFQDSKPVDRIITRYFDPWTDSLRSSLERNVWYRARKQEGRRKMHKVREMGAPPPERARGGRANPPGIPYLYVASDQQTAAAEIRAEPGEWVTVASVSIVNQDLTILDLSQISRIIDPFAHDDLDKALMVRELLGVFAYELTLPIREADSEFEYVVTQFIAEYFRHKGFDGILFPSSLTAGVNAVFFDPTVASLSTCVELAVWSKTVEIVDSSEFDKRDRVRGTR